MRKYSFLAVFFTLLFSLSVTAAYACQPGCDCANIMPVMENRAEAKRLETKAHAREVLKQNDNAPGMTCFDRALMLTAKLGGIFSDVSPGFAMPIGSTNIFGGPVSYPDYGASIKLVRGLDAVVSPTLEGHVVNFTDSLSHALGATIAGYLSAFVSGPIQDFLDSLTAPLGQIAGFVTDINTWYNTLQSAMNLLGLAMPSAVITGVATINMLWGFINGLIGGMLAMVTNLINGLVDAVVALISSALHGLLAVMAPDGECSRIARLYGNGFWADLGIFPDWRPLQGGAVERGTPYFTMFQMLTGAIPNTMGTPGLHLIQELTNATNSTIVSNALADIMPGGALSAPGILPSWPTPPLIPVSATVDDIISQM